MVTKLSFKGDKKKIKKRTSDNDAGNVEDESVKRQKTNTDDDIIMINNKLTDINTVDSSLLESGWSTANVVGDLNGPAILIPLPSDEHEQQEQDEARVISIGEDERIELSRNLDINDDSINFNSYEDDSIYQKLEPKSGAQVFILTNVLKLVGSKEEIRDNKLNKSENIKLSLKSKNDFNLTSYKDDLQCDSSVLTDNEIFQFIKVKDGEKIRWRVKTLDGRILYLLRNGNFKLIKDEENLIDQLFLIRVHMENTVIAKKIKLLKSEI